MESIEIYCNKCTSVGQASPTDTYCRPCRSAISIAWNRANKSTVRNAQLKRRYGITLEQYEKLYEDQGGLCAICCGDPLMGRSLSVDHDRECCPGKVSCGKCIRGLLCHNCNTGIGHFYDDPELLDTAAFYIRKHRD